MHSCMHPSKKNKIKKTKRVHAFINALFKKNRKSNFMHSNMFLHSNEKFTFMQSFMHT